MEFRHRGPARRRRDTDIHRNQRAEDGSRYRRSECRFINL
jgi:hypothetical protein